MDYSQIGLDDLGRQGIGRRFEFEVEKALREFTAKLDKLPDAVAEGAERGARAGAQGVALDGNRPPVLTNPEPEYVSPGRDRRVVSLAPENN